MSPISAPLAKSRQEQTEIPQHYKKFPTVWFECLSIVEIQQKTDNIDCK